MIEQVFKLNLQAMLVALGALLSQLLIALPEQECALKTLTAGFKASTTQIKPVPTLASAKMGLDLVDPALVALHQAVGDIDELLRQQGSTQITAPHLKDETIKEIEQLIRRRENKAVTSVEHPTERLEHFFVRIVEEAQASRVATAGVEAGGELPDFLSEEQGETIVETLVSAADQPTAEVVAASAPDRIQAQEDPGAHVLSDLMETAPPAEEAEHRPQEAVVAASDASVAQPGRAGESSEDADGDVDRGVIDALLDKSEDGPGG